jgi:predicted transcriptional regulator YdeE
MGKYEVTRSIEIDATVEKVMEHLVDFRDWKAWSPWLILDSETKLAYEGEAGEIGSTYSWESESIGSGNMVLDSVEEGIMQATLHFFKPWKSEAKVTYTVTPKHEGCEVTWSMASSLPWFMFWMKKKMVLWVGRDFERGLRLFKTYIEKGAIAMELEYSGIVEVDTIDYIGLKNACYKGELPEVMGKDFEKMMQDYQPTPQSMIFNMTTKYDMAENYFEFVSAISDEAYREAKEGYIKGSIPKCEAVKVILKGEYAHLENAWAMAYSRLQGLKRKPRKDIMGFEVYVNDPREVAPEETITEIYVPLR